MRLNQALRAARERAKLTQQELANKVGVTDAYINQLETGAKGNPSLDILRRLAAALGIPVAALLGEAPAGKRSMVGRYFLKRPHPTRKWQRPRKV